MKHTFTLTLALTVLLSFLSCTKTEEIDKLPPITTEGKNTFGCLDNGKARIPETDEGLFNEKLSVSYENGSLSIQARIRINNGNMRQSIIVPADFTELGIYQIPPLPFGGLVHQMLKIKPWAQ